MAAILGEKEYQVFASLGTTNYTRFGIWYRLGAKSATRGANNQQEGNHTAPEGGPGAFAYSPLDPTMAGTVTNPAFPLGGSARYVGETVAHMHTDVLTGTVMVDVSWADVADSGGVDLTPDVNDTPPSNAGMMTVTLSGMADFDGDPLTYHAAIDGDDPVTGFEIADIVFANLPIEVGLQGSSSGQLIVGAEGTADATSGNYTYTEIAAADGSVRYRLASPGMV